MIGLTTHRTHREIRRRNRRIQLSKVHQRISSPNAPRKGRCVVLLCRMVTRSAVRTLESEALVLSSPFVGKTDVYHFTVTKHGQMSQMKSIDYPTLKLNTKLLSSENNVRVSRCSKQR